MTSPVDNSAPRVRVRIKPSRSSFLNSLTLPLNRFTYSSRGPFKLAEKQTPPCQHLSRGPFMLAERQTQGHQHPPKDPLNWLKTDTSTPLVLTFITEVINHDHLLQHVWWRGVDDAVDCSDQCGESLIVKHKDHTGCGLVFRVVPVLTPAVTFNIQDYLPCLMNTHHTQATHKPVFMFASMHMNRYMHVYVKDLAKHKQKEQNYQHL